MDGYRVSVLLDTDSIGSIVSFPFREKNDINSRVNPDYMPFIANQTARETRKPADAVNMCLSGYTERIKSIASSLRYGAIFGKNRRKDKDTICCSNSFVQFKHARNEYMIYSNETVQK